MQIFYLLVCKMPKMNLHPGETFVRKITNKFWTKIVKKQTILRK